MSSKSMKTVGIETAAQMMEFATITEVIQIEGVLAHRMTLAGVESILIQGTGDRFLLIQ